MPFGAVLFEAPNDAAVFLVCIAREEKRSDLVTPERENERLLLPWSERQNEQHRTNSIERTSVSLARKTDSVSASPLHCVG